jgi:phospholipase D1/2
MPERCGARAPKRVKLASYNIHRGFGRDGKFVPARISDVLAEIDADVIALQEVESAQSGFDMLAHLAREARAEGIAGATLLRATGHQYGNAIVTRLRALAVRRVNLSVPGHEPRGALDVDLDCGGEPIRIVNTHLGLRLAERQLQVRRLLRLFGDDTDDYPLPVVLMGDVNEWFLWGRCLRWLHQHFDETPALKTFPARFPLLALDRIWVRPGHLLQNLRVHASPLARVASDHLPLVATFGTE